MEGFVGVFRNAAHSSDSYNGTFWAYYPNFDDGFIRSGRIGRTRCQGRHDQDQPARSDGTHGESPSVSGLDVLVDHCLLFGKLQGCDHLAQSELAQDPGVGLGHGELPRRLD